MRRDLPDPSDSRWANAVRNPSREDQETNLQYHAKRPSDDGRKILVNQGRTGQRELSLVTSIPPVESYRQGSSSRDPFLPIRSFQANGFDVASINPAVEIEGLKTAFPSIAFVPSGPRSGMFGGRYGPSLGALFHACKPKDFCGIVNADIYMLESAIADTLAANPERFYVARRLEMQQYGGRVMGTYQRGIDAMFFDPARYSAVLEDLNLSDFHLGAPFWDIVTPVIASFHGQVSFVDPPFILHVVHEANWSDTDYALLRRAAVTTVVEHAKRYRAVSPAASKFLALMEKHTGAVSRPRSERQVRRSSRVLNDWLLGIEARQRQWVPVNLNDEVFGPSVASIIPTFDVNEADGKRLARGKNPVRAFFRRVRQKRNQVRLERFFEEMTS